MNDRKKKASGFTLVEVIAVLVIIGLLLAIALPSVNGYLNKAREKACFVNMSEVLREYTHQTLLDYTNTRDKEALRKKLLDSTNCPGGGTYSFLLEGSQVTGIKCSLHGETKKSSAGATPFSQYTAGAVDWEAASKNLSYTKKYTLVKGKVYNVDGVYYVYTGGAGNTITLNGASDEEKKNQFINYFQTEAANSASYKVALINTNTTPLEASGGLVGKVTRGSVYKDSNSELYVWNGNNNNNAKASDQRWIKIIK